MTIENAKISPKGKVLQLRNKKIIFHGLVNVVSCAWVGVGRGYDENVASLNNHEVKSHKQE